MSGYCRVMIRFLLVFYVLSVCVTDALVSCPVGTYCPYGIPKANDKMIGYYKFSAGSRLNDSVGVLGNLILEGTVTYSKNCQWQNENCLDCANTGKFKINNILLNDYEPLNAISTCTWFTKRVYGTFSTLFHYADNIVKNYIFAQVDGEGYISVVVNQDGLNYYFQTLQLTPPFVTTLNVWYHICFIVTSQSLSMYLSGTLIHSTTLSFKLFNSIFTDNYIGGINYGYTDTVLDEFRIYNIPLSQEQVTSIYTYTVLPCPVGTFQNKSDQLACMWCADEPNSLYQAQIGQTKCQNRVLPSMYSPNASTLLSSDNNLIGYYPFSSYSPTTDMSGVMGNVVVQGSVLFSGFSPVPWGYAPAALFPGVSSCLTLAASSINPLTYTTGSGITVGFWLMMGSGYTSTSTGIFLLGNIGYPYIMARFNAVGANGLYYQWRMSAANYNERTVGTVTLNVWMHVVFVIQYPTWKTYVNGVLIDTFTLTQALTGNLDSGILTIGSNTDTCSNKLIDGTMSEFRIYNRALTLAEVVDIYSFRVYYCHAGTSNVLMNQQTCSMCPVNTFQASNRETTCTTCVNSYNTQPGSIACPSAVTCVTQRPVVSTQATEPGQVQVTDGTSYLSFGCPAGTFFPSVKTVTRLTQGCSFSDNGAACAANSCCIWMSSKLSTSYEVSRGFTLSTADFLHTMAYYDSEYVAIDLLNIQYVSYVLFYERTDCCCSRENNLVVYVGNTLVDNTNRMTPAANTNAAYRYPSNDYRNTPCAVVPANTDAYRTPMVLACKTWGRYVYISHYSTVDYMNIAEIIVLGEPPCSECQAGSYSNGIVANVNCAKCPAGTFQSGVGMSFCQNCPAGTFQTSVGQAYCNVRVPPGSYSISDGMANAFLMGYYTFFTNARLVDSTGVLGNPTTPLAPTPTYISDGAWTGSEALDLSSAVDGAYLSLPAINLGTMNIGTGFSICLWYYAVSVPTATNNTFFEFSLPSVFSLAVNYSTTTFKLNLIVQNATNTATLPFSTVLGVGGWMHMCVTGQANTGLLYENGASTGTFSLSNLPNLLLTSVTFAAGRYGLYKTRLYLDEIRIYSKVLTAAEIATLYLYRVRSCAKGTYQDKYDKDMCKPCAPGYAQTMIGQSSCTTCSYATWYGTSNCASSGLMLFDAVNTDAVPPPGVVNLVRGMANLWFNCPSGTYSTTVSSPNPLSSVCQTSYISAGGSGTACTAGQCCIWATASMGMPNNSPIDALLSPVFTSVDVGNFIGIDLATAKYIDTILFFDARDVGPQYTNGFSVFVGNVSYKSPSGQVSVYYGDIPYYTYPPLSSQQNVLCYQDDGTMSGYRNPVTIRCRITARYIYLVAGSGGRISMSELAVLDTPACTLCPAGTFSVNTQPNTKCSPCPVGHFQSMAGMSYCSGCSPGSFQDTQGSSTCKYCSQGFYQPEYGRTFCMLEAPLGYYSVPQSTEMTQDLIAYYSFWTSAALLDGTEITGPLTAIGTPSFDKTINGPFGMNSDYVSLDGVSSYLVMPGYNYHSLSIQNGFMICMWFHVQSFYSTYQVLWRASHYTDGAASGYSLVIENQVLKFLIRKGASVQSFVIANTITLNTWHHVCFSLVTWTAFDWKGYYDGSLTATFTATIQVLDQVMPFSNIGYEYLSANYYFKGFIDEFRLYDVELTAAQVLRLYNWRPFWPCPVGSFQDTTGVSNCKPCGIGTFQNETGKTTCKACTNGYNMWYGASICATAQIQVTPAVGTSLSTTPGVYTLSFSAGAKYLSFNVPSGYYSNVAGAVQTPVTDTCVQSYIGTPCPAGPTCCIFTSGGSSTLPNAVDGTVTYAYSGFAAHTNQYIAVDFRTANQYIDSVLIFDSATSGMVANNGLAIYIGNVLYGSGNSPSTAVSYPVINQYNTLCANFSALDVGYRYPKAVSCKMTGRYLYVVMVSSTLGLTIPEFAVLTSPPGTACPAGTFSTNVNPTATCSLCPAGTYATGTGMTSASDCVNCPLGQYATGMGGSSASVCVTC